MSITTEHLLSNVSSDWYDILDNKYIDDIVKFLNEQITIFGNDITPPIENIFEFARLTDLNNIKIVIIGQDVYPKKGDAHGLAFSCLQGIPASLKNIYKCLLKSKLIANIPKTGNLSNWAKQGVLLLNCALTTEVGIANAHAKVWQKYTDHIITKICNIYKNKCLIFILWGNFAKSKTKLITNGHILEWAHPSPLAQSSQSFIECDNFIKANKILEENKMPIIQWGPCVKQEFIFTDGSAYPNKNCPEAKAGYAVIFKSGVFDNVKLYGQIDNTKHYATNQRAEGYAILNALKYLYNNIDSWEESIFITDSEFWICMIEKYMPSWKKKKIAFNEKKNPDITIPLYDLYLCMTLKHQKNISFRHIKSHNKDGWNTYDKNSYEYFCYINNDAVDKLANIARTKLKNAEDIIDLN